MKFYFLCLGIKYIVSITCAPIVIIRIINLEDNFSPNFNVLFQDFIQDSAVMSL